MGLVGLSVGDVLYRTEYESHNNFFYCCGVYLRPCDIIKWRVRGETIIHNTRHFEVRPDRRELKRLMSCPDGLRDSVHSAVIKLWEGE